jgi:hypothetical protein
MENDVVSKKIAAYEIRRHLRLIIGSVILGMLGIWFNMLAPINPYLIKFIASLSFSAALFYILIITINTNNYLKRKYDIGVPINKDTLINKSDKI